MAQKLYIVHGWTYTLAKWDEFTTLLREAGVDPVMLRVPGLTEPSDAVWDVDQYVDWLEEQIGVEDAPIVMGHSNGGRIIMAYDAAHPGKLRHMILMSSAGVYHDDTPTSLKRRLLKPVAKLLRPVARGPLRRILYRIIGASDYGNAKPNMRKTMSNLLEHDKGCDPSTASTSATLIWGERDKHTPLSDGKLIHERLPNAGELHVVHEAGHSPQASHPALVAEIVSKTLEELD